LSRSNTLLFRSTSSDKFVTLIYGLLDPENNKFKYSNAGHDNPFLIKKNKQIKRLKKGGIVLGIMPEYAFEDETVVIQPGDILVLYSDGIIDAQNLKKERFGEEQLADLLKKNRSKSAQDIIDAVVDGVNVFSHNMQQSDDITIVVVKRVEK
jgi:sigma-B regulation protein RsbU (phosphoserine phosphatase)